MNRRNLWRYRRAWGPLLLCGMWAGGCGRPVLTAEDTIVRPDGGVRLRAYLEWEAGTWSRRDLDGRRVTFHLNDDKVGEAWTDEDGSAEVDLPAVAADARVFEARYQENAESLVSSGSLFRIPSDRTIVVVDIDQTISDTQVTVVLKKRDRRSQPIAWSRETLTGMASNYGITYLTARPRSLMDKTRDWLVEHGYPEGPLFVSQGLRDLLAQTRFKRQRLAELRRDHPNILIGIGDTSIDANAYGSNDMLTLIVGEEPDDDYGWHSLCFRDWRHLARFITLNHQVLTDAVRLGELLSARDAVLLWPVLPYDPDAMD